MTASLRAARALVLLLGFHLMGVLLLAALAVIDALLLPRIVAAGSMLLFLVVPLLSLATAVPILRGMAAFLLAGRHRPAPDELTVGPEEQPGLWAEVTEAARAAGTRAPDELHLTADVNAGVGETPRLLGLLPGRRRMVIGVPLLAGLTVPQLRAVLAHEYGHFVNHDTRLATITMRGRTAVEHTVAAFGDGTGNSTGIGNGVQAAIGGLYVRYGLYFLKVSQSVAQRQELAADRDSAHRAGRDTAAAALRLVPVLAAAHHHYTETYALMGAPVGSFPPVGEFHGGFRRMLAARSHEALATLARARKAPRPSRYDSHPPMAERVALIEALPADGRPDDPAAPSALSLLRDQDAVLAALEAGTLPADHAGATRLDWPDLVMARAMADAADWAGPLRTAVGRVQRAADRRTPAAAPSGGAGTGAAVAGEHDDRRADAAPPALDDVLDAIDAGLLWTDVAACMPKPAHAQRLTGAPARNFLRPRVWDALAGLVHLHLVAGGLARPDVSWSGRPGLTLPDVWERRMDDAIDAATADAPDTAALRALLAGESV